MSFLEQFLPSVCRSTYPNLSIFVVDNDSSDNTVDFLKLSYPNVHILRHPKNNGFADGYNQALRQIKSEYYVLLNQDVEVERGWIEPVISLMEQHGNWAACQPKIRSFTRKQYFEYAGAAGGWMDKWGYTFCRGRLFDTIEVDSGQYDQRTEIFWASGAALFIRSGIFHQLGGFDPSFFAHMEEIDLCWRIHLAGFAVGYCPGSVVYHVGGGSLPQGNPRKTYLNYRNNLLMMSKNLPEQGKESILFLRRILDTIAAVKLLLTGNFQDFRAIIRAHLDFRTLRPQVSVPVSRRLLDLPGVYHGSVVWEYFILGKRRFHDLKKAPNK
jgi:GT2 family glycosyltransferase